MDASTNATDSRASQPLTAAILVPTFRRAADLRRCILAVASQLRAPDEFIIVVRDIDDESQSVAREYAPQLVKNVRVVTVDVPGQVQALSAGANLATSDIIAITDDDAMPHADWLARIVSTFEGSNDIGGVGGRDLMRVNGKFLDDTKRAVGQVPAIGRHVGNHHAGYGLPRDVDMLKGVNGAYRRQPLNEIGFDFRLRGTGAQVHWEISLGQAFRRRGWRLVYDPAIMVNHFLASRFDEDQRDSFNAVALSNAVYNETFIRLEHRSTVTRLAFMAWAILIGTKAAPGSIQLIRFLAKNPILSFLRFRASMHGRFSALRALNGR